MKPSIALLALALFAGACSSTADVSAEEVETAVADAALPEIKYYLIADT